MVSYLCIFRKTFFLISRFKIAFVHYTEECKQYHKAFQVDPFSQVSPSVVLSETISMILIHPLKSLGSGIGDFLRGVNSTY